MKTTIILGAPGCGKTTKLLSIVDEELSSGVLPREICFTSFTRKAVQEAVSRASEKFGLDKKEFNYFKTLHSLSFRQLGIQLSEIMGRSSYKEIGTLLHLEFGDIDYETGLFSGAKSGDMFAQLEQESRLRKVDVFSLKKSQTEHNYFVLKRYVDTLRAYKESNRISDFTDIITRYSVEGTIPNIKVLIVDEAQDLNNIQWDIVKRLSSVCERVYIAGDDDQAIFNWAGADVDSFLALSGDKITLPVSYRLPTRIYNLANKVSSRLSKRFYKDWSPKEAEGTIRWLPSVEYTNIKHDQQWLFLARHNHQLQDVIRYLRSIGILYMSKGQSSISKDDMKVFNAYRELLETGEVEQNKAKLIVNSLQRKYLNCSFQDNKQTYYVKDIFSEEYNQELSPVDLFNMKEKGYYKTIKDIYTQPLCTVSTIHSIKGGEADNVYLILDLSRKASDEFELSKDDETRLFYVAITRSKQNLFLQSPTSKRFFPIYL